MGPGLLVTAAFMGPGTVLTASLAGAEHGGRLLWALAVAVVAAIVLQEMAARFALVTRRDLGEGLVDFCPSVLVRRVVVGLILGAILVGNTAYQAGNFTGAATGLSMMAGGETVVWVAFSAGLAAVALLSGRYRLVQALLVALVVLMSAVFVSAAVLVWPSLKTLPVSAFRPAMPDAGFWVVMALIGTTVVPYNLFLHARSVQEKWPEEEPVEESISQARWDTVVAVVLGGLVSAAILMTAVATFYLPGGSPEKLGQIGEQLAPVAGNGAKALFSAGLFAAGLTSAITAPLAAAFATAGCLGWGRDWADWRFRGTALGVVIFGALAAGLGGGSPRALILFAQGANGILLPFVAVFLMIAMNRSGLLGKHVNGWVTNVLGSAVILLVVLIGGRKIVQLFLG